MGVQLKIRDHSGKMGIIRNKAKYTIYDAFCLNLPLGAAGPGRSFQALILGPQGDALQHGTPVRFLLDYTFI